MERYDAYEATIKGNNRNGVFMIMENGEPAFSFYGELPIGTRVIVSIIKLANERFPARVAIESVCYADAA
ncbi:MAG: hypothetical protein IKJ01_05770 [Lachnospiraceae bacterium]|nr:hypothetical protein [Lachnospiraceae bacterium]